MGIIQFSENIEPLSIDKNAADSLPFPYFILVVKALFLLRQRNAQNYALETYWLSELLEIPAALPENMLADVEADLRTDAIRRL